MAAGKKYKNLLRPKDDILSEHGCKKISMHDIYMNLAIMLSLKSTCRRGQAGCVVVRDGRIISTGYNGAPAHETECIEREACRQKGSVIKISFDAWTQPKECIIDNEGCFDSIHGEVNALGFCSKNGIKTEGSTIYLTGPPCKPCSQLMVAAGIKEIYYYDTYYRNDDGLVYAKTYGIDLHKVSQE